MSNYIYDEVLDQAQRLPPDEQLRLLEEVAAHMRLQGKPRPKHSILELEGLGAEVWKGIDVQKYIDQERDSWDG